MKSLIFELRLFLSVKLLNWAFSAAPEGELKLHLAEFVVKEFKEIDCGESLDEDAPLKRKQIAL